MNILGALSRTVTEDRRRRRRLALAIVVHTLALAAAGRASAQSVFTPYAGLDVEHDTNIFYFPPAGAVLPGQAPRPADTFLEARAGADEVYQVGRQQLFATAEFRRFAYDRFTALDHNEFVVDGGLNYKIETSMDGAVEYKHEQRMVQFTDLTAANYLILETENTASASFNVNVTPEWRIESKAVDHTLDSPRADVPDLSLHEDTVREGLRYIGVSNLSAGVDVEYAEGKYRNDPFALTPKYHQTGAFLAATYTATGLSRFVGSVGYTDRADSTVAGISGVTGELGYRRNLSGKTTLDLDLRRALASYVTTGGNEIDTTGTIALNWQVTYKIEVSGSFGYTESKFPDTPEGALLVNRTDHYQIASLEARYQIFHWLSIRPYARYQTRHSNIAVDAFNNNVVGIEFLARRFTPKP